MKASVRGVMVSLVAVVLLFFGGVSMFQDRQLYFPENPPRAAMIADAHRHGLIPWPSEADYRGLLSEPAGPVRATAVLFHGNAGHAGHRDWYAEEFTRLGVRVILAEYPAYGSRAGKLGEASLVADAVETLSRVRRQFPGPLLLVGESLGAGVASAAAKTADVDAVLLITPWDTLAHVAGHHFPWLPVDWLLRDRYDSVANLATYRGRVAVVIAERDGIVPPGLGRHLFESLAAPKRRWTVPGADHNGWMRRVDAVWWQAVVDFLLDGQENGPVLSHPV